MGFVGAIGTCLAKVVNFRDRARRKEYWYFVVFLFLLGLGAQLAAFSWLDLDPAQIDALQDPAAVQAWVKELPVLHPYSGAAFVLVMIYLWLAQLSVTIRRLHDINRSGWWILMPTAVSIAAGVAMVVFTGLALVNAGMLVMVLAAAAVPLLAYLWLLVLLCLPGTHGHNRFGPDPVPDRRPKAPTHAIYSMERTAADQKTFEAQRRAEIKDLYRTRVLGSLQQTRAAAQLQ